MYHAFKHSADLYMERGAPPPFCIELPCKDYDTKYYTIKFPKFDIRYGSLSLRLVCMKDVDDMFYIFDADIVFRGTPDEELLFKLTFGGRYENP